MSLLTDSNNINLEVCHIVLSQSVYALLSLIQAMLNMSTLSMNDQAKSFWELVYGSLVWRSPFPVTLQRILNTCLKIISLVVFCCNFWTLQQKPHDYICSGCKNMVSQKCVVFIGPPCTSVNSQVLLLWYSHVEVESKEVNTLAAVLEKPWVTFERSPPMFNSSRPDIPSATSLNKPRGLPRKSTEPSIFAAWFFNSLV